MRREEWSFQPVNMLFVVQLTPQRSLRPDKGGRQPPAGDQKTPEPSPTSLQKSPMSIPSTTPVADNDETPPPLPEKSTTLTEPHSDYANVGGSPQSRSDNLPPPVMRRTTHRGRVCFIYIYIYNTIRYCVFNVQ